MIEFAYWIILLSHIIGNFYIVRFVQRYWTLVQQKRENRIFIFSISSIIEPELKYTPKTFIIPFYLLSVLVLGADEILKFILFFFLLLVNASIRTPEKNNVLESCHLNIGYGAALWYYENYLKVNFPRKFEERVECFKSFHKVHVEKKLFILVPKSCKVQQYLDSDECIERSQELPTQQQTLAGVKDRVYNITIYHVKKLNCNKGVRLAVEYAQPLKGLYVLREKQNISEKEMFNQRQLFVESLKRFLIEDKNDLYKYCELIEYDDARRKISDVLLERCIIP